MNNSYLINKALLSEKTYKQMETGIYTFLVAKSATKDQIAKEVEAQFSVKVAHVNIAAKKGKTKKVTGTRKTTQTKDSKKAIVFLKSGQSIEMLSPKTKKEKAKKVEKTNDSEEKKVEKTKSKGLLSKFKKSKTKDKNDS